MIKDKIIDNSLVGIRSIKNMPFQWLGSSDFGRIVPFHVQELMPTDRVEHCQPRIEMQMLPLASPTFGEFSIYVHYFFVPFRQIWDGAYDVFSTTGPGNQRSAPSTYRTIMSQFYTDSLMAHYQRSLFKHWTSLGLPPFFLNSSSLKEISLMPFFAYNKIWWDFYRNPEVISDDQKNDFLAFTYGMKDLSWMLQHYSWFMPKSRQITDCWQAQVFSSVGSSPISAQSGLRTRVNTGSSPSYSDTITYGGDTSQKLRLIEALTRIAERRALSGKRQIDLLYSTYGVKPDFAKLDLCEYLGGAKKDVLISDITATADTLQPSSVQGLNQGLPLGFKAGSGYCALDELDVQYEAKEHGYLMGVFSIVPKVHFVQGLFKHWNHIFRDDFFKKELEHTGLVAIRKDEVAIGANGQFEPSYPAADDDKTYAFSQPYYEYTYNPDILAGDFMYYHHSSFSPDDPDIGDGLIPYMQSMEQFIDFNVNRDFSASSLNMDAYEFNKVFYYLGGNSWEDVDDHFHVRINCGVRLNRPMDGFAVPTVETTQDPHAKAAPVGQSTTL